LIVDLANVLLGLKNFISDFKPFFPYFSLFMIYELVFSSFRFYPPSVAEFVQCGGAGFIGLLVWVACLLLGVFLG